MLNKWCPGHMNVGLGPPVAPAIVDTDTGRVARPAAGFGAGAPEVNAGRGVMAFWSNGETVWYCAEAVSIANVGGAPEDMSMVGTGGKTWMSSVGRVKAARRAHEIPT